MHGVEEEGVCMEGAGVEVATVAMVDMETTKVAIIRVFFRTCTDVAHVLEQFRLAWCAKLVRDA
jgi:hypothetical protein